MSGSAASPSAGRGTSRARRTVARTVHLTMALLMGFAVYAPTFVVDPLRPWLQFAVVPAATLTGVFLWKQAAIQRFFRRARHRVGASS